MEQEILSHQVINHTTTSSIQIANSTVGMCLIMAGYVIIAVAILMHIFGIMLIIIKSSEMTNLLILLMHLSFISIILLAVTTFSIYKHLNSIRSKYKMWLVVLYYIVKVAYICNLVLLTLDRLFMTFFDIRYRIIVTRTKLYIALAALWMIAIAYGVLVKFSTAINYTMSTREKVSLSYNGFAVLFTFAAYTVMSIKVKCMASKLGTNNSVTRDLCHKRLIPFLMVLFFFMFSMLPSIIEKQLYSRGDNKTSTEHARMVKIGLIDMHCLNHLLDPIIYILFQRCIRKKFKALCCCICNKGRYQSIRMQRRKMISTSSDLSNSLDEIGIDNNGIKLTN